MNEQYEPLLEDKTYLRHSGIRFAPWLNSNAPMRPAMVRWPSRCWASPSYWLA
jgi:hypothetical protein